jgi:hypothetical protein
MINISPVVFIPIVERTSWDKIWYKILRTNTQEIPKCVPTWQEVTSKVKTHNSITIPVKGINSPHLCDVVIYKIWHHIISPRLRINNKGTTYKATRGGLQGPHLYHASLILPHPPWSRSWHTPRQTKCALSFHSLTEHISSWYDHHDDTQTFEAFLLHTKHPLRG